MNIAILGQTFGDEGKGHITHWFSPEFDWIIRFNGGANAGHTIYRDDKKYVHNILPSADFRHSYIKCFLASGMVIDLEKLLSELLEAEKDYPGVSSRVYVDPDAFVVLDKHKEEDKAKNGHIGTTNRGIGPAYASKIARHGTKVKDILNQKTLIIESLLHMGVNFKYALELKEVFQKSKLLFEGAQGILLDINHGTYPYVSSSDCTISGIYSSGFGFAMPTKVYGVGKCYSTRVGEGPFPTEMFGDEAEKLRKRGNEYGATTGRPRRIGWLDLPAIKYAIQKSGITDLIITKLDILAGYGKIDVCHKYEQGEPVCGSDFFTPTPAYTKFDSWGSCDVSHNGFGNDNMKKFISFIEQYTGCSVSHISCGVTQKDIINYQTMILRKELHNHINQW